jgi:hypothetical protein
MADRSVSTVFSDIIGNAQEIIRAEVLLVKTGLRDEVIAAKRRIALLASGALAGIFAVLFILVSAFHALASVLPEWSSALIVAVAMAAASVILLNAGNKAAPPAPAINPPVESIQEDHA